MRQWGTLLAKECLEMWRNFKWIWVPVTFILLGVNQPLSSYYMPQIIDAVGGLPKGAVIKMPVPSAAEVIVKGLSQYTSIGVLIIVLTAMGLIAAERKSGVAAMILVKPVSYSSFVTAKWAGSFILLLFSFFLGYLATWYYTGVLFDWVSISTVIQSYLLYSLWFAIVLTVTVFFSASMITTGLAGFCSLAVIIIVNIVSSSFSHWIKWSPAQLTDYSNQLILTGNISKYTMPSCLVSIACIIILLVLSIVIFRKKELTE
jgi:ABC-2 type transport system permease protein